MIKFRQKEFTYLFNDYTTQEYNNKEVDSLDKYLTDNQINTIKYLSKKSDIINEVWNDCPWIEARGIKKSDMSKLIDKLYKVNVKKGKYIELSIYFKVPGYKMEWLECRYSLTGKKLNHWNSDVDLDG